jgi:hypothetical protein
MLADSLKDAPLKAGDSLLLETRSGYAYERIPKSEVEEPLHSSREGCSPTRACAYGRHPSHELDYSIHLELPARTRPIGRNIPPETRGAHEI